jgi:hypothetical protein
VIRQVSVAAVALGLAIASASLHARTLTSAEQLTAELMAKIQGGTLSDRDILNVQFSIRLPVRENEGQTGSAIADYLATLKGCATTGVLQRTQASYPDLKPGQDVVDAVFDCSARDDQPMFVRFMTMFEGQRLTSVFVQKGLQVG